MFVSTLFDRFLEYFLKTQIFTKLQERPRVYTSNVKEQNTDKNNDKNDL